MAIPATFFDKVVADLAQTYGVVNGDDQIVENSPVVALCVRLAYSQIVAHTGNSFHWEARTVCYYDVYGPLQLKHFPIDTGETIEVYVNTELQAASDYVIEGGVLYLGDTADPNICYSQGYEWRKGSSPYPIR
jgi:hypothetical protein